MAFTYRFINNDSEVIYVGKAENLEQRLKAHRSKKENKYKEMKYVEYIEVEKEIDAFILETYYINKYDPKYNNNWQKKDGTNLKIYDYRWELYTPSTLNTINQLKAYNKELEEKNYKMKKHYEATVTYEERNGYRLEIEKLSRKIKNLEDELNTKQEIIDLLILGIETTIKYLEQDKTRAFKEQINGVEAANVKDVRKILYEALILLEVTTKVTDRNYSNQEIKEILIKENNQL